MANWNKFLSVPALCGENKRFSWFQGHRKGLMDDGDKSCLTSGASKLILEGRSKYRQL
jgi:hypothetical protein